MEKAKEAGEKRKVVVNKKNTEQATIFLVKVITQKEDKSIQEKMKKHGEAVLDKESGVKTDVKIEWQLKRNDKEFNLCIALIELLKKMGEVDPTIYIKSGITNEAWKTDTEIPTNDDVNKAF
eukprot:1763131-Ditylum_brightwellii.AAC.1